MAYRQHVGYSVCSINRIHATAIAAFECVSGLRDYGCHSCQLVGLCCACCAGYQHPVDAVVTDLVSCLVDDTLPLMQFSEAFAVVQVNLLAP